MTALCVGRDPEMWSPSSPDARLAMAICRRCAGCPDNDPNPHGVIRQGVPYGDRGKRLPLCPACARPAVDYLGGAVTLCRGCAVPDIAVPDRGALRATQVRWLFGLGFDDPGIAEELGLKPNYVKKIRNANGCLHRKPRTTTPKEKVT